MKSNISVKKKQSVPILGQYCLALNYTMPDSYQQNCSIQIHECDDVILIIRDNDDKSGSVCLVREIQLDSVLRGGWIHYLCRYLSHGVRMSGLQSYPIIVSKMPQKCF